jgi:hypothetical protein
VVERYAVRDYPELDLLFGENLLNFKESCLCIRGSKFGKRAFKVKKIFREIRGTLVKDEVIVLETYGPRFEFWISQQKLLTPLDLVWYKFNDNLYVKPANEKLLELVRKAEKRAGPKAALERATGWCRHQIALVLNKKQNSLRISSLKSLLTYRHKKYDWIGEVNFICHSRGGLIKLNSVNLSSNALIRLLGTLTADGSIARNKNSYLIEYTNHDKEIRELRLSDLKCVFGEIKTVDKYVNEKRVGFKLRSGVVGKILNDLGAPMGNKMKQNPPLPWIVNLVPRDSQVEYFRSVFTDEGCLSSPSSGKQVQVAYSRAGRLPLKPEYKTILDQVFDTCFSRVVLPSGVRQWTSTPQRLLRYIDDLAVTKLLNTTCVYEFRKLLQNKFKVYLPRLLKDELELLLLIKFRPRLRLSRIYASETGEYSAVWEVQLYRKSDVIRFYFSGGFLGKRKQARLTERLKTIGWLP